MHAKLIILQFIILHLLCTHHSTAFTLQSTFVVMDVLGLTASTARKNTIDRSLDDTFEMLLVAHEDDRRRVDAVS